MIDREREWELDRAKWKQMYDELRRRIEAGVYKPRYPIPSLTQLEQEFGVAKNTARKVVARLVEDGLVRTEHGVGTFVAPAPPSGEESGE